MNETFAEAKWKPVVVAAVMGSRNVRFLWSIYLAFACPNSSSSGSATIGFGGSAIIESRGSVMFGFGGSATMPLICCGCC